MTPDAGRVGGLRQSCAASVLPAVLIFAAAAGPLAHLLRISEALPARTGGAQPLFRVALAGNLEFARRKSAPPEAGAPAPREEAPETRILKPVTDHWDTASGVPHGHADVPTQPATPGSLSGERPACPPFSSIQNSRTCDPQRFARGPPPTA